MPVPPRKNLHALLVMTTTSARRVGRYVRLGQHTRHPNNLTVSGAPIREPGGLSITQRSIGPVYAA